MRSYPWLIPVWNWLQWAFSGQRLVMIGSFLVICLLLGRVFGRYPFFVSRENSTAHSDQLEKITVGRQHLFVEVAQTPAAIQQGLSDRAELGADGMLFVLPHRSSPSFWMLRMQFGLDIIWLDNGKIVQIDADVPPPSQTDGIPTVITPKQPVTAVLEVPAGTAQSFGWRVGTPWSLARHSTGTETVVQ